MLETLGPTRARRPRKRVPDMSRKLFAHLPLLWILETPHTTGLLDSSYHKVCWSWAGHPASPIGRTLWYVPVKRAMESSPSLRRNFVTGIITYFTLTFFFSPRHLESVKCTLVRTGHADLVLPSSGHIIHPACFDRWAEGGTWLAS